MGIDVPRRPSRNVKAVIPILLSLGSAFAASSCSVESICVRAGTHLVLRGMVANREVSRLPTFGDSPDLSWTRIVPALRLKDPIDICRTAEGGIDGAPIRNVAEVQLVNYAGWSAARDEVEVAGVIQRAQNADHYYVVVLVVD